VVQVLPFLDNQEDRVVDIMVWKMFDSNKMDVAGDSCKEKKAINVEDIKTKGHAFVCVQYFLRQCIALKGWSVGCGCLCSFSL
jgi:hypothetical protein